VCLLDWFRVEESSFYVSVVLCSFISGCGLGAQVRCKQGAFSQFGAAVLLSLQLFMKRLELCDDPAAKEYLRYTTAQMMEGGEVYVQP
jgi:hypothetical protein